MGSDFFLLIEGGGRVERGREIFSEGSTEVAPTKKGSHSVCCNSLFLLEPITGLEPVTY